MRRNNRNTEKKTFTSSVDTFFPTRVGETIQQMFGQKDDSTEAPETSDVGIVSLDAFYANPPEKKIPLSVTTFTNWAAAFDIELSADPQTTDDMVAAIKSLSGNEQKEFVKELLRDAGVDIDGPKGKEALFLQHIRPKQPIVGGKRVPDDPIDCFLHVFRMKGETAAKKPREKPIEAPQPQTPVETEPAAWYDAAAWTEILTKGERRTARPEQVGISKEINLYDGLPVTAEDGICLELSSDLPTSLHPEQDAPVALFDESAGHPTVVACGHLQGKLFGVKGCPRLVLPAEEFDSDLLARKSSFQLAVLCQSGRDAKQAGDTKKVAYFVLPCSHVTWNEVEETEQTLCIDFGTSNTTAGSYGVLDEASDEPEIVTFPDVTDIGADGLPTQKEMLPTLVYVKHLDRAEDTVSYAFGYEAARAIVAQNYTPMASVFHEIKAWEGVLDAQERVQDEDGAAGKLVRRAIVKAYLEYVIQQAEHHFKHHFRKIHFSAPVKLKESFIQEMKKTFDDAYDVRDAQDSLDEGVAIVYDLIHRACLNARNAMKPVVHDCLILDCGGGTTDLALSTYTIENKRGYQKLTLDTKSEGGNANFGGNNITYRILQLLKIKLAASIREPQKQPPTVQELIPAYEERIMLRLDKAKYDALDAIEAAKLEGREHAEDAGAAITRRNKKIYQKLDEAYDKAEALVPTRFDEEENNYKATLWKRNFYSLWKMAENIKIQFFRAENVVDFRFNRADDYRVLHVDDKSYYLNILEPDGTVERIEQPMKDVAVTIKEINRLICPDLYALLLDLLPEDLAKTDCYYQLSGQSCKINLFNDLMKEFIPGRDIRSAKLSDDEDVDDDEAAQTNDAEPQAQDKQKTGLKMACLRGCIRYVRDCERGDVQLELKMAAPKLFYQVFEHRSYGDEKRLSGGEDGVPETQLIFFPTSQAKSTVFFVIDPQGEKSVQDFRYNFQPAGSGEAFSTTAAILDQLKKETYLAEKDEDTEEILDTILRDLENDDETPVPKGQSRQSLLLLPATAGYGFLIVQIGKSVDADGKTTFYLSDKEFHKFREEARAFFFDGRH